jgi:hypothetical protein
MYKLFGKISIRRISIKKSFCDIFISDKEFFVFDIVKNSCNKLFLEVYLPIDK